MAPTTMLQTNLEMRPRQQLKSGRKQLPRGAVEHSRFRIAAGSEGAFKLTFATLLIVAALGFTYTGSDGDFPRAELHRVLLHVMAVNGVLLVAALVLPRGRGVSNAALAFVTLTGVFSVYVVHTELFHPANRVWMNPDVGWIVVRPLHRVPGHRESPLWRDRAHGCRSAGRPRRRLAGSRTETTSRHEVTQWPALCGQSYYVDRARADGCRHRARVLRVV